MAKDLAPHLHDLPGSNPTLFNRNGLETESEPLCSTENFLIPSLLQSLR